LGNPYSTFGNSTFKIVGTKFNFVEKIMAMTSKDLESLKQEFLCLLDYYLQKTDSSIHLYQDTAETQYFLFALYGTKSFLVSRDDIDSSYLAKCIDGLISEQSGRVGYDRLTHLRQELEEELNLLKLRFDLN